MGPHAQEPGNGEKVKEECGSLPDQLLVDCGYFSLENLNLPEEQKIDGYLPDSIMAPALSLGKECKGEGPGGAENACAKRCEVPRKASLWPAQDHRRTRLQGVERATRPTPNPYEKGASEFTLANIVYDLTRMYSLKHSNEDQSETQSVPNQ